MQIATVRIAIVVQAPYLYKSRNGILTLYVDADMESEKPRRFQVTWLQVLLGIVLFAAGALTALVFSAAWFEEYLRQNVLTVETRRRFLDSYAVDPIELGEGDDEGKLMWADPGDKSQKLPNSWRILGAKPVKSLRFSRSRFNEEGSRDWIRDIRRLFPEATIGCTDGKPIDE